MSDVEPVSVPESVADDVPEADAIEQAEGVPGDEDERR